MGLSIIDDLEFPIYLVGTAWVSLALLAIFYCRAKREPAAHLGKPRYILIALCALWMMLSPILPLAGFVGAMMLACVSPAGVEATQ